jgi:hypothetical protein
MRVRTLSSASMSRPGMVEVQKMREGDRRGIVRGGD